jgi:hypothetical protein
MRIGLARGEILSSIFTRSSMRNMRHGLADVLEFLFSRVGRFRTALLCHTYGLVLLSLQWHKLTSFDPDRLSAGVWSLPVAIVALSFLIFGSRVFVLIASTPVMLFAIHERLTTPAIFSQVADEYLVYALQPLLIVAAAMAGGWDARRRAPHPRSAVTGPEADEAVVWTMRILVVMTMFFAGFHKINADFLDEAISCHRLARELPRFWSTPFEIGGLTRPSHIIAGEIGAAFLLLLSPRLGILLVAALVTGFAHIGPVAFATSCLSLSLSFLRAGDLPNIKKIFRQTWATILILCAATLWVSRVSYKGGQYKWSHFALFEVFLVVVVFTVVALIAMDLKRAGRLLRKRRISLAGRVFVARSSYRPIGRASLANCALVLGFLFFMGMSTYTGAKFRFGFAMLSNLRADEWRFNHLIVPRSVMVTRDQPFVFVSESVVSKEHQARAKRARLKPMSNKLIAAWFLDEQLRLARKHRVRIDLTIQRRDGTTYRVENAPYDEELRRDISDKLMPSRLFQKHVAPSGPQRCVH